MGAVTEHGPEGYDYQYLASLYIILHFLLREQLAEVFIDKLGKEDLTLGIGTSATSKRVIEVQFKNRSSSFNLDVFLSCITKFTANRHDENILSRIESGTITSFIILTSGVTDGFSAKLKVIAKPYEFEKSSDKRDKKAVAPLIKQLNKDYRTAATSMQQQRKQFLVRQQNSLTEDRFTSLLDQITLIDRLSKRELWKMIEFYLSDVLIPLPAQRTIIFEALELIKVNRGKGTNVLPLLKQLIALHSKNLPSPDPVYLDRGDEQVLSDLLKKEHVLLLTGLPLCGKTQTAIRVAQLLTTAESTIDYFATTTTREAEKLLYDNVFGPRLCYLEDPTGTDGEGSKEQQYRQLESLIHNLPKGKQRYLIVTAPSDESEKIVRNGYLNEFHWNDLTVNDSNFLLLLWTKLRYGLQTPLKLNGLLANIIKDKSLQEKVQPGQLAYLSKNFGRLLKVDRESLLHFIHFRSPDITHSILTSKTEAITAMMLMGISSSVQSGLNEQDILYFSDFRTDYLPSINKKRIIGLGSSLFGTLPVPAYRLNQYEGLPKQAVELKKGMALLMDMGYIQYQARQYKFTHPIYREAARNLYDPKNPIRFEQATTGLKKGIGCLNAHAAMQASRNLTFIAGLCTNEELHTLPEIAEIGLSSTFVSVRDLCLLFLIDHFETLSTDSQNNLKDEVRHRSDFRKDTFMWENDITFIPDEEHVEKEWSSHLDFADDEMILEEWVRFVNGAPLSTTRQAWDLLTALTKATEGKKERISYDITALTNFLRYDENFIREQAAFLIAASVTDVDVSTIEDIFAQEDPFVNYQLIKGLFRSWPYFTTAAVKSEMESFMVRAYDNLFIVLSSIEFFSQFSAGHTSYAFDWRDDIQESAVPDMWYLWGELMPVFFKHLPASISMHNSRFVMTFREAQVTDEALSKIFSSCFTWLKEHLSIAGYHTSLADDLIGIFFAHLSCIDPLQRLALIQDLLSMGKEVFRAKCWRLLVYYWRELSDGERAYLKGLLPKISFNFTSIILTTDGVPKDIQQELMGFTIDSKTTEEIVQLLPPELLVGCLASLYVRAPFDGFDYKGTNVWNKILETFLYQPEHPAFAIALTTFFTDQLILGYDRGGLWDNPEEKLRIILTGSSPATRALIFHNLLDDLAGTTSSGARRFFELLVPYLTAEDIISFEQVIDQYIEAISTYKNLNQIPPPFVTYIRTSMSLDVMVTEALGYGWLTEMDSESKVAFAKLTVGMMKLEKIRTLQATEAFRDWARENRTIFSTDEMEIVDAYLSKLLEKGNEQRYQLQDELHRRFVHMMKPY